MANQRQLGAQKEKLAADYLRGQGMRILAQNFRCRRGEIDLVGEQDGYLVFVEVKFRSGNRAGSPEEAVGLRKQKIICRTADFYRAKHGVSLSRAIRYDVVAIQGKDIRWYPNAFPHIG